MDPVREALDARLKADATLVAMLYSRVGVYHRDVPTEAKPPLIVFHKQSGTDEYTFGARAFLNQLWLVKAIHWGLKSDKAEDIAARIDVVLMDAPLTLSTGVLLYLRRESEVDYSETMDMSGRQRSTETYFHCGGLYRIVTTP